jgi:hypothetical protein
MGPYDAGKVASRILCAVSHVSWVISFTFAFSFALIDEA